MSINKGIIVSGNGKLESKIINVGDNANITVDKIEDGKENKNISELLAILSNQLDLLPNEKKEEKQTIKYFADLIEVEGKKETPNKSILSITAKGLLDASNAIKDIAPPIFDTIKMIFDFCSIS